MTGTWEDKSVSVTPAPDCYLCGSPGHLLLRGLHDRRFGVPGTWDFFQCRICRLIWLNPRPLVGEIGKLYVDYYTHSVPISATRALGRIRSYVKGAVLQAACSYSSANTGSAGGWVGKTLSAIGPMREAAERSVMWLASSLRGSLLDVGCGNGQFLATMRDLGWDVQGVEPDPIAAETARRTMGLAVECSTLEHASLPRDSFDAVTLNHVIEHVIDPIATLRECGRVLKEGGRLVVVTPNASSLGRKWFRASWYHWDSPRHIFLFTLGTLRAISERAGLAEIGLTTATRSAPSTWIASQLIRRKLVAAPRPARGPRIHDRFGSMLFWIAEYLLAAYGRPRGEELVLVATKRRLV